MRGVGSSVRSGRRAAAPAAETVGGGSWPTGSRRLGSTLLALNFPGEAKEGGNHRVGNHVCSRLGWERTVWIWGLGRASASRGYRRQVLGCWISIEKP